MGSTHSFKILCKKLFEWEIFRMTFQWVHFMTSFMCTNMFPDIDIKIYHLIAMRIMRRFGSEFFFIPLGENFSKSIEFLDKNMHLAHKS